MSAVVIASILGSIAVIASSLAAIFSKLNGTKIAATAPKIEEIRVSVNSRLDDALTRIADLQTAAAMVQQAQDVKDATAASPEGTPQP